MITGELEYLHSLASGEDHQYDYFLKKLFGKKTEEEKQETEQKRNSFWDVIGKGYQELGGVEGIIGTAQGVKELVKPSEEPSDFEVNMGHGKEEEETKEKEKGISKEVLIIGGIAVFAVGIWGVSQYRKNQMLKQFAMNK